MGVVYSAYDEQLDRKIALKYLEAGRDEGTSGQPRLLREAQALARVSHPNVVQVYEVGAHGRDVYIAMEFVSGRTLRAWIGAPRPWREILGVYLQAGRGLAAAHAAGLVHRDFKPDNVMLGEDGRVRVMDFGLARTLDEPAETLQIRALPGAQELSLSRTAAGRIIGTPAYMAPEQHAGATSEARTDQFAYCVALYEALYGQRPFEGEDLRSLTANVSQGRVREPSRRDVPRWLRRILLRGLSVEVSRRWPSMQALLAEVDRGQVHAQRRGVATALAIAGVLAAGAWGWHAHDLRRRAAACAATGASIEALWNDEVRADVRQAFAATGLDHAATTADKLMPWLDRQAEAWAEARSGLCMDSEREHADAQLQDRALWCLDERRMALESLVAELSHPDAATVQRAVLAAATLEPVAQCRDAFLLAQLPTPATEGRPAVQAVQAELLRAGHMQSAGRFDEGVALAQAALTHAEGLAWPPLVAAARLRVGSLLRKQGKHLAQAEAALEGAYFEAAEAGASGVQADAAIELVQVISELARPADGQRWARLAELALRSLEPRPGLRAAHRLNNLGNVHSVAGEYETALALYARALAIREEVLGPDHPLVAISLNNLATNYVDMGTYATVPALHERALAIRERALGPVHPDVANTLDNLAVLHIRSKQFSEALPLLRRALEIRERTLGLDHLDVANSLNNLAAVYKPMGEAAQVKPLLERALAIRERSLGPDHPTVAQSLGNLAMESLGNPGEARALQERAQAIYERVLGPDHPNVADSLFDLAKVHAATGDHVEERRLHERALAIREQALGPDHPDVATSLQYLANLDLAAGAYPEAKRLAERALAIHEAALGREHHNLIPSLECLAGVALATQDAAGAAALATRALALYGPEELASEPGARLQFLLARALWDAGRDRSKALELAAHARAGYGAVPGRDNELAAVGEWLATHRIDG